IVSLLTTSAMAGGDNGGGAKDDGSITVRNDEPGYVMAVAVGADPPNSVSEFLAQGAQFVQPGDTSDAFDVAAGSQSVTVLFVNDVTFEALGPFTGDFNVDKNEELHLEADAGGIDEDDD